MKSILLLFCLLTFSASFSKTRTWKCIDESGNVKFTFEAKFAYAFSDGLARFKTQEYINNAWVSGEGYINTDGKIVIPSDYEKTTNFVNDRAWVKKKDSKTYTLINKEGKEIPTKGYEKVGYIIEGYSDMLAVYENGAMGWINRDGKEVIPCKYRGISTFDKEFGLACVMPYDQEEEKYGFINKSGEIVLPFQYRQGGVSAFHNGVCRVAVKGKTVMINEKGEVVFASKYGSVQRLNQGWMGVPTGSAFNDWVFVNMQDEILLPEKYDNVHEFNEDGFSVVEKNGLGALINAKGEFLTEMKYETIYYDLTEDGYICGVYPSAEPTSLIKAKKDYFDKDFNLIDMQGHTLMGAAGESLIPMMNADAKRGYMNRKYEVVIPAIYSKATDFNGGFALVSE